MALAEDMDVFFNTAEFAVGAVITKSDASTISTNVIFDVFTEELWDNDGLSDEHTITVPTGEIAGVRSGDSVLIGSANYKIRYLKMIGDGTLTKAKMTKVL